MSQLSILSKKLKLGHEHYESKYPADLLSQYGLRHGSPPANLSKTLLSPRAVSLNGFYDCCLECHSFINKENPKLPKFAIANGFIIGQAPSILYDLNSIERTLVSKVRNVAHVYTFFGGRHKSIRGWHTFFEADVSHTMGTLNRLDEYKMSKTIFVVLTGPFISCPLTGPKPSMPFNG